MMRLLLQVVATFAFIMPRGCEGGITVLNDEIAQTQRVELDEQELLVDRLAQFNQRNGKALEDVLNLTAVFLSESEAKQLCDFVKAVDPVEKFPFNWTGIEVVASDFNQGDCFMNHLDRLCLLVPYVVGLTWSVYPGWLSNTILDVDEESREGTRSCTILEGRLLRMDLIQGDESVIVDVQIASDGDYFFETFKSLAVQIGFRVIVPICYLLVGMLSAHAYFERKRIHKTISWAHAFVLGLNVVQGVLLGILNFIGIHNFGDTITNAGVVLTFANFFSLSVATDLVFARMLSEVRQGFKFGRQVRMNNERWIVAALVIICVEFVPFIGFAITQSSSFWFILTRLMPLALTLCSLIVTSYLILQMREIAAALIEAFEVNVKGNTHNEERNQAQLKLARIYYFWTKVSIVSIVLGYIAAALTIFGILHSHPIQYVITIILLDASKLLNMLAQTRSCRSPSATNAVPSSYKTSKVTILSTTAAKSGADSKKSSIQGTEPQ